MKNLIKMINMNYLYRLEHNHYTYGYLQHIYIGIFSSKEEAEKIIEELIIKPGFKLHPRSCFIIKEVIIDDFIWKKGFLKTIEGDIEIK